jgi:hypothetical protein
MRVLIGDANGADKIIQKYFVNKGYDNVIVFCSGKYCRNNLGNWPTKHITPNHNRRDFAYYAAKDLEMAKKASYGFMIWDGKSKGTLNNVLNLLQQHKKVLVYFSPDRSWHTLGSLNDVRQLLDRYGITDWHGLNKELSPETEKQYENLFSRLEQPRLKSHSAKDSHTAVASMGWLLSVGIKL